MGSLTDGADVDKPDKPGGAAPPNPFAWKQPWAWADAAKATAEASAFSPSRAAEKQYERQLKSVAKQIKSVLATSAPADAETLLREYEKVIEPWARQSAVNMLASVQRKNVQAWRSVAGRMGIDMRVLLGSPGVGAAVSAQIAENTQKIRSLVIGAADGVAALVQENLITGTRAEDLAAKIAKIGEVSETDARRIARTEVSKANTALTLARAESIGSIGYIWRTARDGDTRESHRAMEGVFVRWDSPPTLDGMTGHAGDFPNCRCYPEPVVPKEGGVYQPALPTQAQERNAGEKRLLSKWEQVETNSVIPHAPESPLHNVGKAAFVPDKLTRYSLDPAHPSGGPKATAFRKMLGIRKEHADLVEKQVMGWLSHLPAVPGKADKHGERFNVYVPVTGPNGRTVDVMTAWIYERNVKNGRIISTKPRLTNCFIDSKIDERGQYRDGH